MKYRNKSSIEKLGSSFHPMRGKKVPVDVRYDGLCHYIGPISDGQKRCAQCGKKVQRKCNKCNVALHVECFEQFHCN